jgi:hypothetical protein
MNTLSIVVFLGSGLGFIYSLYSYYLSRVHLPLPYLMLFVMFFQGSLIDFCDLLPLAECSSSSTGMESTDLSEVKRPMSVPEKAQTIANGVGVGIGFAAAKAQCSGNKAAALGLTVASGVMIAGGQAIGQFYNTFSSAVLGDGTGPKTPK